jgi:hypothetical protein
MSLQEGRIPDLQDSAHLYNKNTYKELGYSIGSNHNEDNLNGGLGVGLVHPRDSDGKVDIPPDRAQELLFWRERI